MQQPLITHNLVNLGAKGRGFNLKDKNIAKSKAKRFYGSNKQNCLAAYLAAGHYELATQESFSLNQILKEIENIYKFKGLAPIHR